MRIDEEERQNLPVSRLRGVGETEGLDAVLEDVGEGDKTTFFRQYAAEFLNARFIILATENDRKPRMVLLFVVHVDGI